MTLPNEQNLRAKPDGQEAYWHSTLDGELPVMQLSADYPRPVVSSFLRARASVALDPLVYRQIRNTCQQKNVTLFVFLLAAFKMLLLRHTTQEDIIVSSLSSASTRSAQGTNRQRFTNVLALRTNLEGNPDFVAVLKRVSKTVEEAGNNRDYPFEKLVEYIQSRQASLSPIFQTMFILRDTPSALASTPISEDNLADVEKHSNKYDLVVLVCPKGETLTVTWEYDAELFESTTIVRLLDHYQVLLEGTGANPEQRLSELPFLTEAERHQLLVEWNDTKRDYPKDKCIHELFEAQVERIPDAVAVVGEGERLSYRELDDRADRLARQLRAIGVRPDVLVGICLERSVDLVVGLLGILKAGGAYVPIDPAYPAERIGLMIDDSAMTVLLTQERLCGNLPESRCRVVSLEQLASEGELHASEVTQESAGAENLAYVIYTSGSTGRPKGVEIQHKALVNFLHSMRQRPGLTPQDVLLSVTTISFDIAGLELFLPLIVGACVVIVSREVALDGRRLMEQLENSGATVMQATPATWRMLIDVGWSGRKDLKILCGGEALAGELASQLLERGASLWNLYGPTESTIWSTLYRVEAVDGAVPIGRPIGNTEIYILDRYLKPVPVGVPGELHIGGAGLARCYLNRPELTEEKFIRHPFSTDPSARLYKTGDLARYLSDGNIEYLGRLDHQIKIRGFRIELGEIESMLSRYPGVRENVVVAWEVAPGDKRLVAYSVFAQTPPPAAESLRSFLKEKLPDYMVPSAFVELDALPLTPNGKVDRKALPAPDQIRIEPATTFIAPRNPIEEVVAEIWADVLKIERIGIDDNFFDLGGHSLLATQLLFSVSKALDVDMPLARFFEVPTVAEVSAVVAGLRAEKEQRQEQNGAMAEGKRSSDSVTGLRFIVPEPQDKYLPFPLTDIQQAYWIGRSGTFDLGNVATHVYTEYECRELDLERFNLAWQQLIDRHDMLRAIVLADGRQQILEQVPPYEIEVLDLRGQDTQTVTSQLEIVRQRMSHQVLPADRWPLFEIRASLLEDQRVRLHVSRDVLMIDAWSWSILSRELCQLYQSPNAVLPPLELSFRDYVLADIAFKNSDLHRRSKDYWWDRLSILPPAPELPVAKDPSLITSPQFVRRSARFEPAAWKALKNRAARLGLTETGLLLGAFADVLRVWSKSPRFTINLTLFNRLPLHPQVNEIVGDLTSLTLLEVANDSEETFEKRARHLQQQLWKDLDHRFVSGVEVMRELAKRQGGMRGGIMPVVFTSVLGQQSSDSHAAPLDKPIYGITQTPQVWLDLQVFEEAGALVVAWDAVAELFPHGMLDAMFDSYCRLLRRLVEDGNTWHESWPETAQQLVPSRQLEQREAINSIKAPMTEELLHTLFAVQVPQRPNQAAIISSTRSLTYEELHRCANQIGRWLRQNGARRNSLVAVVMEKGWEQVAGVLGVLASGAAYLPIDAGLPKDRLWHLLQHGEVELVLTQPHFNKKIEWPETVKRLIIDDDSLSGLSEQPLDAIQSPEDIAYVIYTSGSTGLPKGVVIDHRGAVNTILDLNWRFTLTPKDRVLALSSLSFDLSVYDIFGILAAGGTIVVPDAAGLRDPAHWADLIARHRVTLWNSVPALMQMLVEYLEGRAGLLAQKLRFVFMSGDWIPVTLPERIWALDGDVEIISMGGATEASIWSIIYPIEEVDPAWKSIPYGRPMVNQTFHVLNEALEPCPVWVPGHLFIGGIGLAKGYWRDEEKTRASFIHHPRTGERLYRTGDQGRYLPDGNIEFLGRDDFQVKVQGYRVELEEIETVLAQHPGVRSSVVTAVGQVFGDKRLVAYLVPKQDPPPAISELTRFLKERLPEYMLPSAYVTLDHLPLSSNGKVDRRTLREPSTFNAELGENSSINGTSQTARIASLVADVLKVNHIDPEANLLNHGATSIDMIRIVNLMERELNFRPKVDVFYRFPSVAALASSYEQHLLQEQTTSRAVEEFTKPTPQSLVASFKLLLDPEERAVFKSRQPGLRQGDHEKTSVPLPITEFGDALKEQFAERRSHRKFALGSIPLNQLSQLLGSLREIKLDGKPKYLYSSAGGLYPIQTYLHVKPRRVEGLSAGTYYYHPADHRLVALTPDVELDRDAFDRLVNRPIYDEAAFAIFLIAQLKAIAPMYGEHSPHFVTIEAGAITQLLETSAPEHGLGLCQIGTLDFPRIRALFALEESHILVHSLLGGGIDKDKGTRWSPFQESHNLITITSGEREEGTL